MHAGINHTTSCLMPHHSLNELNLLGNKSLTMSPYCLMGFLSVSLSLPELELLELSVLLFSGLFLFAGGLSSDSEESCLCWCDTRFLSLFFLLAPPDSDSLSEESCLFDLLVLLESLLCLSFLTASLSEELLRLLPFLDCFP